jgi:hypothetical protein
MNSHKLQFVTENERGLFASTPLKKGANIIKLLEENIITSDYAKEIPICQAILKNENLNRDFPPNVLRQ